MRHAARGTHRQSPTRVAKPNAATRKLLEALPAFRSLALAFDAGCADVGAAADRLGRLAAVRAELEQYESQLKEVVIENGELAVEGRLYRATVSTYEQKKLDLAAIRADMTKAWLKKYSLPPVPVTQVRVKARIGAGLGEPVAAAAG
jgi:hypothetical protein